MMKEKSKNSNLIILDGKDTVDIYFWTNRDGCEVINHNISTKGMRLIMKTSEAFIGIHSITVFEEGYVV